MLAKQISKDREIFCTAETPLTEVFNKMNELNCACMPVVESLNHRNIIGCVTEHDICSKLISGEINPKRANAGRVMNGKFTTVGGEASLEECRESLMISGAERLFVVDENGAFLGVLTDCELVANKPLVNLETVFTDYTHPKALPTHVQLAH